MKKRPCNRRCLSHRQCIAAYPNAAGRARWDLVGRLADWFWSLFR